MSTLADWVVVVSESGLDEVKKKVGALPGAFLLGEAAAKSFGATAGVAMSVATAGLNVVLGIFSDLFGKAMDSKQGEALQKVLEDISDIISRAITPFIAFIASSLERFVPILERVMERLAPLIDAFFQILDVVTMVGAAIVDKIVSAIEWALDLLAEFGIEFKKLTPGGAKKEKKTTVGGIEDPTAIFKRIQETGLKTYEKQSLSALDDIRKYTKQLPDLLQNLAPNVGN